MTTRPTSWALAPAGRCPAAVEGSDSILGAVVDVRERAETTRLPASGSPAHGQRDEGAVACRCGHEFFLVCPGYQAAHEIRP